LADFNCEKKRERGRRRNIWKLTIVLKIKKDPPPASWIYQNWAPMERVYNNKSSQGSG